MEGNETGMFEVPAGGRRYRALELLVKQKRMAKTQPVPCVVRDQGLAEDDSLAENDQRVGLHPLDQFRAFQILRGGGLPEEDIAARHFMTWRSRCETSSSFAFWRLSARVDLLRMAAIGELTFRATETPIELVTTLLSGSLLRSRVPSWRGMNPHGFSLSAAGLRSLVRVSRSRMRSPGEMVRTPQIVGKGIADEGASLGDLEPKVRK
jgi:hypothetical protein